MQRKDLERLSRDELVARAETAGIARPRSLTTAELLDELVLRGDAQGDDRARSRGWFGRARDLLKTAIERGLHLSENAPGARPAARSWPPAPPPPLPTVTLAEIYAAQGHLERAVQVLDEVLAKDAEHVEARRLRGELGERIARTVVGRSAPTAPDAHDGGARAATEAEVQPAVSERDGAKASTKDASAPGADAGSDAALDVALDEIDEVVAVAVDPSTVYLYWEVRPETVARARVEAPQGALTVRTVSVAAGSEGPLSDVRDDRVDTLSGELFVRGLRDGAHVRVSVGWRSGATFVPLAVAAEVSTPRASPSAVVATELGTWSPPTAAGSPSRRRPRFVGGPGQVQAVMSASPGALPWSPPMGEPPRPRSIRLQPTEVFEVPTGAPRPVGVWRPPGSSDLALLYADDLRRIERGGASDLVLGASDMLVR